MRAGEVCQRERRCISLRSGQRESAGASTAVKANSICRCCKLSVFSHGEGTGKRRTFARTTFSLSRERPAPWSFRDQTIKRSGEHPPVVTASPCAPPATKSGPSSGQPPPHNRSCFLKPQDMCLFVCPLPAPLVFLFRGGYPKGDETLLPATAPLALKMVPLSHLALLESLLSNLKQEHP